MNETKKAFAHVVLHSTGRRQTQTNRNFLHSDKCNEKEGNLVSGEGERDGERLVQVRGSEKTSLIR